MGVDVTQWVVTSTNKHTADMPWVACIRDGQLCVNVWMTNVEKYCPNAPPFYFSPLSSNTSNFHANQPHPSQLTTKTHQQWPPPSPRTSSSPHLTNSVAQQGSRPGFPQNHNMIQEEALAKLMCVTMCNAAGGPFVR